MQLFSFFGGGGVFKELNIVVHWNDLLLLICFIHGVYELEENISYIGARAIYGGNIFANSPIFFINIDLPQYCKKHFWAPLASYDICDCLYSLLKFFYKIIFSFVNYRFRVPQKKDMSSLNPGNANATLLIHYVLPNYPERYYLTIVAHLNENNI